jgi:hypothetical protein
MGRQLDALYIDTCYRNTPYSRSALYGVQTILLGSTTSPAEPAFFRCLPMEWYKMLHSELTHTMRDILFHGHSNPILP